MRPVGVASRLQQVEMVAMTSPSLLVGNGSFGPDALGILNQAFDNAWAEIAGNFADDALEMESARNQLADALLRAADREGCTFEPC